jgi:hypothetical protein
VGRRAYALPLLAGLLGFAGTLYLFLPGFTYSDSVRQFQQVVTGQIDNAHPPIMVYVWAAANRLVYGPAGMLALQDAGYWAGLVLVALRAFRGAGARMAFVLGLGLLPPLFGTLATVWKDSQALAALLLASGLAAHAVRRRASWSVGAALLLVFYALALRFNNVLTVVPLVWLLAEPLSTAPMARRLAGALGPVRRRSAVFAALSAAMLSATCAIDTLGVKRVHYVAAVPLWDLAQISLARGELLVPRSAITNPQLDLARLEWISRPYRCDYRSVRVDGQLTQDIGWQHLTGAEARAILWTWLRAIVAHPREYLAHRLRVSRMLLFGGRPAFRHVVGATEGFTNPFTFEVRPGYPTVQTVLRRCVGTPVCLPWPYAVLATAVLLACLRRRGDDCRLARAIAASGLLSVAPLVVIAPSTDLRYSVWLIAAAPIAAALALPERFRRSASEEGARST